MNLLFWFAALNNTSWRFHLSNIIITEDARSVKAVLLHVWFQIAINLLGHKSAFEPCAFIGPHLLRSILCSLDVSLLVLDELQDFLLSLLLSQLTYHGVWCGRYVCLLFNNHIRVSSNWFVDMLRLQIRLARLSVRSLGLHLDKEFRGLHPFVHDLGGKVLFMSSFLLGFGLYKWLGWQVQKSVKSL